MIEALKIALAVTAAFLVVHFALMKMAPTFSMNHFGMVFAAAAAGMIVGFVGEPLKLFTVARPRGV